jgi:D-lactate dehydrogenase
MKDGVVIVNTARGAIIDTEALIKYLKSGKVSYAALDVLEAEPEIKEEMQVFEKEQDIIQIKKLLFNHILFEMEDRLERVIITPHNAFNSKEALEEIKRTTVDNIISFINCKPINVVA